MARSWPWQRKPEVPPAEAAEGGADAPAEAVQRAEPPAAAPAPPVQASGTAVDAPSVDVAFVPARRAAPPSNAGRDALAQMGAGMGDASEMLMLGDRGGINETAVFLKESLETSERVQSSDFSNAVMRAFDADADGDGGDFAGSLTSLLSFSDPQSIINGSRVERPFGKRVERTADVAQAEASPLAGLRPFEPTGDTRPADPRRMGYSGGMAGLTAFQPVTPAPALPVDAARNAPRTMRKLADALSHESASAPAAPTEPFVARSVPAGTELPTLPAGSGRVDRGAGTSSANTTSELPTFAGVRSPRPREAGGRVDRSVDGSGGSDTGSSPSRPAFAGGSTPQPAVAHDGVPTRAGQVTLTEPFRARPRRPQQQPPREGESERADTLQRHTAAEAGSVVRADEAPGMQSDPPGELGSDARSEGAADLAQLSTSAVDAGPTRAVPTDTGDSPMSESVLDLPFRTEAPAEGEASEGALQRTASAAEIGSTVTPAEAAAESEPPGFVARPIEASVGATGGASVIGERDSGGIGEPIAAPEAGEDSLRAAERPDAADSRLPAAAVARLVDSRDASAADSPAGTDSTSPSARRVEPTAGDSGAEPGRLEMPLARGSNTAASEEPTVPRGTSTSNGESAAATTRLELASGGRPSPAAGEAATAGAAIGGTIGRTLDTGTVFEGQVPGGSGAAAVARMSDGPAAEPSRPEHAWAPADADDGDDVGASHAQIEATPSDDSAGASVVTRLADTSDTAGGAGDGGAAVAPQDEAVAERRTVPMAEPGPGEGFGALEMAFRESGRVGANADAGSEPGSEVAATAPESGADTSGGVQTPAIAEATALARSVDPAGLVADAAERVRDEAPSATERRDDADHAPREGTQPVTQAPGGQDGAIDTQRPVVARAVAFVSESASDGASAEPLPMPMARAGTPSAREGSPAPGATPGAVSRSGDGGTAQGSEAGSNPAGRADPSTGAGMAPASAAPVPPLADASSRVSRGVEPPVHSASPLARGDSGAADEATSQTPVQRHADEGVAHEVPLARVIDEGAPSPGPELTWRAADGPAAAATASAPDNVTPGLPGPIGPVEAADSAAQRAVDGSAVTPSSPVGEHVGGEVTTNATTGPRSAPASEADADVSSRAADASVADSPTDVERTALPMDFVARRADVSTSPSDIAGTRPGSAADAERAPRVAGAEGALGGQARVSPTISRAPDGGVSPSMPLAGQGARADRSSDTGQTVAGSGNPVQRRADSPPNAAQGTAGRSGGERTAQPALGGSRSAPASEPDAPLVYRSVAAGEPLRGAFDSGATVVARSDLDTRGIGFASQPLTDAQEPAGFSQIAAASSSFGRTPTRTLAAGNAGGEARSRAAGTGSPASAGLVHRAVAAPSTPSALLRDADGFDPAMPELPLVTPPAPRDSGSGEQAVQRTAAHAAPLEMPLVAPAVARAADEAGDDRPRGVEAFGRVSREVTVDEVQTTAPTQPAEPNLDVLTERVWERIRRKLRIERERTRGVL